MRLLGLWHLRRTLAHGWSSDDIAGHFKHWGLSTAPSSVGSMLSVQDAGVATLLDYSEFHEVLTELMRMGPLEQ